jgi:D-serine deaminase-like pyridoxal phosphate-dependent protein
MFERAVALVDDTPALVVDWAVVEGNVERMAALGRERMVSLRPHIKTHKLASLAQLQMSAGAVGVTVAKLGEARVMIEAGIHDVLVAYPIVGASRVRELVDLSSQSDITVALDSWEAAEPIAVEARRRSAVVGVLVEVDTGLHRCGVSPGAPAVELAGRIANTPGLEFRGLMTHEGHAYAASSTEGLRTATVEAGRDMKRTAEALLAAGIDVKIVSMGSSGTARFGIGLEGVNEFRPGTYVFNDRTQVGLGACEFSDCAAVVVATVVSRAQPDQAVIDAGSKTLTSDRLLTASPGTSFGVLANDHATEVARLSEEHGILRGGVAGSLAVGDRVAVVPNHICPVVNLFDYVHVVKGGDLIERVRVDARGMSR